ncbi:putative terminase small subunit [Escherichia coli]|nr:putative terminase small subunit [Escherichia coli]
MSNVSGIGDAYYWSVFKIAEAFGLHRDTVKKTASRGQHSCGCDCQGEPRLRPAACRPSPV